MSRRYSFWRSSASVCVGLRQDSRRVEWELLPVATAQLTPIATFGMNASTYKTERGRQNWPCALLFPSFEKGVPIPRCKSKRALGQMARSNFRLRRLWVRFLHAALIPGLRVIGHRHNLGTFHNFGASAPVPNPPKTGAAHSSATSSEAAATFNLNGQSLG
jgi:hypothetical protein